MAITIVQVGIGLLVLQQLSGINGVLFYSSNIFESAGQTKDFHFELLFYGLLKAYIIDIYIIRVCECVCSVCVFVNSLAGKFPNETYGMYAGQRPSSSSICKNFSITSAF